MSSRKQIVVGFLATRQLIRGLGPRRAALSRDRPKLGPRVRAYLSLVRTLTVRQVAFTLGVASAQASRALEALCEEGAAPRLEDGSYEARNP